jgi:hypothetical protein
VETRTGVEPIGKEHTRDGAEAFLERRLGRMLRGFLPGDVMFGSDVLAVFVTMFRFRVRRGRKQEKHRQGQQRRKKLQTPGRQHLILLVLSGFDQHTDEILVACGLLRESKFGLG